MHGYGYRACPDCGVAVQRTALESNEHTCDPDRYAIHQEKMVKEGLNNLEEDLAWWLTTPLGKFQEFIARRDVLH